MGRTSKLSQDAWTQIEQRLAGGAGVRALAREYGVDASAVSRRFSQQTQQVRDLARRLADVQNDVAGLPVHQQRLVLQLADQLRAIGVYLARAASYGSATAASLQQRAHGHVEARGENLDEDDLRAVHAMTKTANEAASTGLNLLRVSAADVEAERARAAAVPMQVKRIVLVPVVPAPALAAPEKE